MSTESILIRNGGPGSPWTRPETISYSDEEHLERLLAEEPNRIPHVPQNARAVQQMSTIHGPLDICAVGPDGSVTVVECKLAKNSEHRRQKIGQPLDYASALHSQGFESFVHGWKQSGGEDLESFLDHVGIENLERNINSGAINICLAVDRIDDELRRLVEYLNRITRDDVGVTALQVEYVRHGDVEILIPTAFGVELANVKSIQGRAATRYWTWEEFLLSLSDDSDRGAAEYLMTRLNTAENPVGKIWCGAMPGGGIQFYIYGGRYPAFYLWMNSAKRLHIFGAWRLFPKTHNHHCFEQLAQLLGQDHRAGASGVPISSIDLAEFWDVASMTERHLNQSS